MRIKKLILLITAIIALSVVGCKNATSTGEQTNSTQTFNLDTTKLKDGEVFYQCEMHPEVLSDKAGNCPKCGGMELSIVIKK